MDNPYTDICWCCWIVLDWHQPMVRRRWFMIELQVQAADGRHVTDFYLSRPE
jgi:hypothetical protein